MKPNTHFPTLLLLLMLFGCQKEEIETVNQPYYSEPVIEYAYIHGVLLDETTLEPISGVGIINYTTLLSSCGQTYDTTDASGRFELRTCRKDNVEYPTPYPNSVYLKIFDVSSNTFEFHDAGYFDSVSIQTGDTLFFEVLTTASF